VTNRYLQQRFDAPTTGSNTARASDIVINEQALSDKNESQV
jgi:hypothetical protein